tara:strand:+ start:900 stop:1136 length:237 start_codon:yes stop_codon:yes gene_type:complete
MDVKTLGEDQWKWLNKYHKIDLNKWRFEYINKHYAHPEWYYVGDWKPGICEPYPSKLDGGYSERKSNLEKNKYYYWPS